MDAHVDVQVHLRLSPWLFFSLSEGGAECRDVRVDEWGE